MREFFEKWIRVSDRRYQLFTLVSFGLAFLIPLVGWDPLLILWIINACLGYRENAHSKIRFVHAAVAAVFLILLLMNFGGRVFS